MSALPHLRSLLEQRFPDATPVTHRTAEPVTTGIQLLDAILPGGGLPRGRLSVWLPRGGATAVLRAACHTTVASGERAAWIDSIGTIAGEFWEEGAVLVRPASRLNSLRCAEELLRCGGYVGPKWENRQLSVKLLCAMGVSWQESVRNPS